MGRPAVLLLDDGELDDVQLILQDLGVAYARVRGGAIARGTPAPRDLLLATPRRIEAIAEPEPGEAQPVRVVVANEDSPTLRTTLREIGFDYIIRRPVHPEALRLLLLHCLYSGEERRGDRRVAVGAEVSFDTGLTTRRATLADLSQNGCRLLTAYPLEAERRIRLQIPGALAGGEVLTIPAQVLRASFEERLGVAGLHAAAVSFENVPEDVVDRLEGIVRRRGKGPTSVRRGAQDITPESPGVGAEAAAEASAGESGLEHADLMVDVRMGEEPDEKEEVAVGPVEQRRHPRRVFEHRIAAFGPRAQRVLVGRDVSRGGMRVESMPGIEVGDRLHLAIYGTAGTDPFLVWATVTRDQAGEGMALAFDELDPRIGDELERLLASLPAVESLRDGEAGAMGSVVSEILET